jgi:hypothetical protein
VEICGFENYGLIMKICGFADWHTYEVSIDYLIGLERDYPNPLHWRSKNRGLTVDYSVQGSN